GSATSSRPTRCARSRAPERRHGERGASGRPSYHSGVSRYALLIAPSSNRVYAEAAPRLTRAELSIFGSTVLSTAPGEIAEERIGGVPYVVFDGELSEPDLAYLANVSSIYALFERVGDLLRPVPITPLGHFDDDLITIPKYAGKTNEQFTRLLLNVTLLASA